MRQGPQAALHAEGRQRDAQRSAAQRGREALLGEFQLSCPRFDAQIRLEIKSSYASPFNIETFEVEWTAAEQEDWKSIG